jgi:hypothetical protein
MEAINLAIKRRGAITAQYPLFSASAAGPLTHLAGFPPNRRAS